MRRTTLLATGLTLAMAPGCHREADPLLCGDLGAGDLVITEVRGGPALTDADGQWVELYNAASAAVELHGLSLTIDSIGGSTHRRLLIRRPVTVAPGGYAVVGKFDDAGRPAHVDVGWGTAPSIPRDGAITLACAEEIDRITFTTLPDPTQGVDTMPLEPAMPGRGTYALGTMPPTAAANDDPGQWCADPTETAGPCNGADCLEYYKGSPGEPNRGCPP